MSHDEIKRHVELRFIAGDRRDWNGVDDAESWLEANATRCTGGYLGDVHRVSNPEGDSVCPLCDGCGWVAR